MMTEKEKATMTDDVSKSIEAGFKPIRNQMNIFFLFASILIVGLAGVIGFTANIGLKNKTMMEKNEEKIRVLTGACYSEHPNNAFFQDIWSQFYPSRGGASKTVHSIE